MITTLCFIVTDVNVELPVVECDVTVVEAVGLTHRNAVD